ncbi:hypothetical protein RND81_08G200200 [Saponaria officinalis]
MCTLILAIMATLIMTSNPVLGSRSLTRPSNRKNDVIPKHIERKDVHRPRKLDENDHTYPPQDYGLQPGGYYPGGGGGGYYQGGGGYYPGGGGGGYYPGGGGYYGGGGYSSAVTAAP